MNVPQKKWNLEYFYNFQFCTRLIIIIIRSEFFFLFIGRQPSLLMCNAVQQCLAANNILLMRKGNRAFLLLAIALAWKWQIASLPKDIHSKNIWLNDKTIIELGYRKISWFVSVSQINYLPQPSASANNWSACHRQITIFCSTSSNNLYLFCIPFSLPPIQYQSWNLEVWLHQLRALLSANMTKDSLSVPFH